MNQQPDKFFREKFEGYQRPAPGTAWDKISAAQTKKNKGAFWWKIAASFLIVAIAAYLLWPTITPEKTELTQTTDDAVKPSPAPEPLPELPQTEKPQPAPSLAEHIPASKTKRRNNTNPVAASVDVMTAPQANDEPTGQEAPPIPVIPSVPSPDNNMATNSGVNNDQLFDGAGKTPARLTLTYSADDVSEYLDKKSLDEATSDDKKPSTLKKLLKKANDLKTNQDPFGELRQKKNEILALNFKSEKQRGQNK